MASPVSAGDILAFGKLAYQLGNSVVDADKAPKEFQRAADVTQALEGALNHVDGTLISGRPNTHTSDVRALVQNIKATGQKHQQKLDRRYSKKLGVNAPRGRRYGVLKKLGWAVAGQKDQQKHQKDQLDSVNMLQTRMLGLVVENQDTQLSTVERVLAQEESHHTSVHQKVSQMETTLLQRLDDTELSRQQDQTALAGTLRNGLDQILAQFQDQKKMADELRQMMTTDGLQIRMYGSAPVGHDAAGNGGSTPNAPNRASLSPDNQQNRIIQPRAQSRRLPAPRSAGRASNLEAISVLKVRSCSLEFTWWNQGRTSRTVLPNVSQASDEGILLTFLIVLLGMCLELGLELGRYVSSQVTKHASIPSAVSLMMSDTIEFTDALGRNFKLSVMQSTTWDSLDGWLREQFKGCPGSSKVQDGKYVVFDARTPDRIITRATWQQAVKPRRRFQMAIVYEHVQLSHSCPKCDKPLYLSTTGSGNNADAFTKCHFCGVSCSSCISGSLRSLLKRLVNLWATPDQWWQLDGRIPHVAETSINGFKHACMIFKTLTDGINTSLGDDDLDIDLDEDILTSFVKPAPQVPETDSLQAEYSHWRANTEDKGDNEDEALEDDTEGPAGSIVCGPKQETSEQERRERKDLAHFSTVWMERDNRLHDAALAGDYNSVKTLIRSGVDVNQATGRTGSALIAAIIRNSQKVVDLLLHSGADPLHPAHQGQTPVSIAACFAGKYVADLVLGAAFKASYKRPDTFQEAVDTALYEATRIEKDMSRRLLLFMGANPTAVMRGGKSAFAIAFARRLSATLEEFLTMLYDRGMLTDLETQVIFATMNGMDVDLTRVRPWLRVCCASMAAGSCEKLEQEVAKRIRKRGERYFRLNIDNLRCHPDIRAFWRSYENNRLGIFRPQDLAGMS